MKQILAHIGRNTLSLLTTFGQISIMLVNTVRWTFRKPFRFRLILAQMELIGSDSFLVVAMVGFFTGVVFAYQTYGGFHMFGMETMTGLVVALAMSRELGPVLSSIMVTARSSSAIAAELGTMRVTEQIDALHALAVEPIQYLVVPRVIAGMIVMPMLSLLSVLIGILGSYFASVYALGVNGNLFIDYILTYIDMYDILSGEIKAVVFGALLTLIGCTKGYNADGGALGVGMATTEAVALSCIMIIFFDVILTIIMF
jgi:phospholipid/cholesterol/gamma-HCH transport system permease protein